MQGFFATARMCFKEQSYFGAAELFRIYLLRTVSLVALLFIWATLFAQGVDMEGMTLDQMLSYTLYATLLQPLLNVRTPASSWLHSGTVLGLYQRPASIFGQLTAHTVGGWAMQLLAFSLPVGVLAALAGIRVIPVSGWFFPSLLLAISQGFAVDYLFTCLLIRLRNMEWTVHSLRESLSALLTGAVIPFAVLPWRLGDWLQLSPFGTLAGAPLSLLTGLGNPAMLIPAQLFWNITLWPLAIWLFARSRERMVSFGG